MLAKSLRDVPQRFKREARRALTQAGQRTLQQAMMNAAFSSRIPGSLSLKVSFRSTRPGVIIRASLDKAPHARVLEGITATGGYFKHPVYGNKRVWVEQKTRPYLAPAVRDTRRQLLADIDKIAADIVAKIAQG